MIVVALALIGFWVYCLLDVVTADAAAVRGLPKPAWVLVVALCGALDGVAWLLAGRPAGGSPARRPWTLGPGGQVGPVPGPPRPGRLEPGRPDPGRPGQGRPRPDRPRPLAPDDDPEFLRTLDRRLRGEGDGRPGG